MTTLKDVARKAGVNISTASRALNGNPAISEKTALLVKQAASALNYKPNLSARILKGKKSNMIGVIVPETNSDYFSRLVETLEMRLQERGYFPIIANTKFDREKELDAVDHFLNYYIEGIFVVCVSSAKDLSRYSRKTALYNIPLIALDARKEGADCNQIMVDDMLGMTMAVSHLLEKGHKSIGFIGDAIIEQQGRTEMFRQAIRNNGLNVREEDIETCPDSRFEEAGYKMMKRFLSKKRYPDAYLAGCDDMAIGALRAAYENNLSIPDDIAIIGNDNGRASNYLHKRLTTLSPPIEKMSCLGVDMMIECIQNKDSSLTHKITLKPELLIRETT